MSTLDRAIQIAVKAHRGQEYEPGVPYVLHPLRVMFRMRTDEERTVAILHDVVEQTDWSLKDLRKEGFSRAVVQAVDHLSRRKGESYDDFIGRILPHPLARRVKRADLSDNIEQCRGPRPTAKDRKRIAKYKAALARLAAAHR
jgi:hypothetical protein